MIISRKKFEQELANARNEVLQQNDIDCRFRDTWNRVDDTNRRLFDLEHRVNTLYLELHPEVRLQEMKQEVNR